MCIDDSAASFLKALQGNYQGVAARQPSSQDAKEEEEEEGEQPQPQQRE